MWWGEGKWVRITKPLPWLCRPVPGRAGRTKPGRRAGPAAQAGLGGPDDACIAASKAINLHTDNGKCEMPVRPSACLTRGTKRGPAHRPGRTQGAAGRGIRDVQWTHSGREKNLSTARRSRHLAGRVTARLGQVCAEFGERGSGCASQSRRSCMAALAVQARAVPGRKE